MLSFPLRLRPVILLLGDSLTQQSFGVNGGVGWASLLANAYSRRADVLNQGYSGYNSRHVCSILENSILASDYDNVLFYTIFLGANDAALPGEPQHVPLDEFEANVETIVKQVRSKVRDDLPIFLLTPPPVDTAVWDRHNEKLERNPSYRHNDVAEQYGNAVKNVASSNDGCFEVDVFDLLGAKDPERFARHLSDGLHLSGSGNELVFRGLMEALHQTEMAPEQLAIDQYTDTVNAVETTRPSIVLLGDSFTQFGLDNRGWASLLASDYARRVHVLNRGFQGHTTRDLLGLLPEIFNNDATGEALFVTMWLGGNDAIEDGRHVPLDEFEANLQVIVDKIRQRILPPTTPQGECLDPLPIIFITPPPVDDTIAADCLTSKTPLQYAKGVQAVADRCNCDCLDVFQVVGDAQDVWTHEGVHLNTRGNELVHKGLMEFIQKTHPQLAPMTDGNGKYGNIGIPPEGKQHPEVTKRVPRVVNKGVRIIPCSMETEQWSRLHIHQNIVEKHALFSMSEHRDWIQFLRDNLPRDEEGHYGSLDDLTIRINERLADEAQSGVIDRLPVAFDDFYPPIFISFATGYRPSIEDYPGKVLAEGVIQALFDNDCPCYSAHLMTRSGRNWSAYTLRVESKKVETKVLVALMTKAFFRSMWCLQEVNFALEQHDCVIVPVRVEALKSENRIDISRDKDNMWPSEVIEEWA